MIEIINAQELHKVFIQGANEINVLNGISFTVFKDEVLAIVGPSGAGKSTLLYILGLLSKQTKGRLILKDRDINLLNEKELSALRNKTIGFIFQFHYLLSDFTALENILLPALVNGKNSEEVKDDAMNLLSAVGLKNRMNHRSGELSGGEQQRVAIARALINNPELILADEPTGDLDVMQAQIVWELLFNLTKEKKSTLIVVTHNEELAKSSTRVLHIYDGKI